MSKLNNCNMCFCPFDQALIQTCLNSPESGQISAHDLEHDRRMNPNGFEETELSYAVAEDDDLNEVSTVSVGCYLLTSF